MCYNNTNFSSFNTITINTRLTNMQLHLIHKNIYTQTFPSNVMQISHICTLTQKTILWLVTREENID